MFGSLQIKNVNDVLVSKKCASCKALQSIHWKVGFFFGCGLVVDILEVPLLVGLITISSGESMEVSLVGDAVDRVYPQSSF